MKLKPAPCAQNLLGTDRAKAFWDATPFPEFPKANNTPVW